MPRPEQLSSHLPTKAPGRGNPNGKNQRLAPAADAVSGESDSSQGVQGVAAGLGKQSNLTDVQTAGYAGSVCCGASETKITGGKTERYSIAVEKLDTP